MVSNSKRFAVIVWIFVVLILVQSYTVSLTSLLMVKQLRPTLIDVNQLIKKRLNVGYQKMPFVYGMLKDVISRSSTQSLYFQKKLQWAFHKRKCKWWNHYFLPWNSLCKTLPRSYCFKYAIVEPTFKTGGFDLVTPTQVLPSAIIFHIISYIIKRSHTCQQILCELIAGHPYKVSSSSWYFESNPECNPKR